jgi:hypothetical protein
MTLTFNPCGREASAKRQADFSKAFAAFRAQTHVSLWTSKTYQKKGKSHMVKLFVTKSLKKEKERVRLSVGGNRLDYSGDMATSTADITTFKFLINSTLSIEYVAMMMMDIEKY